MPKMKDDSSYTINSINNRTWKVSKFDADSNPVGDYEIIQQGPKDFYCTCLGYKNRSHCRHLDIFSKFQNEGKLGKGFVYSYRNDKFSALIEALD